MAAQVVQFAPAAPKRTKPKGRHPHYRLTDGACRKATPGLHCDGNGLYLRVQPSGAKAWVQRVVIRGMRRELGLGGYPLVPLKQARETAADYRRIARTGGDPLADKQREALVPTFGAAATSVHDQMRRGSSAGHCKDWWSRMLRYVMPCISGLRIGEVTRPHVIAVLQPIWTKRPSTARRVKQSIGEVMKWAIANGHRTDNPCTDIEPALGPQGAAGKVEHMPALPHTDVAAVVADVHGSRAQVAAKLAFEFLVLTAARSGEVRGAKWSEVDTEGSTWTIPAERMKAKREHKVPLSDRALAVLAEARKVLGGEELVFPAKSGKVLHDSQFSGLLKRLGVAAVPHGFRSTFRDWAGECTNYGRDVIEAALAHEVAQNRTEAAYYRSDLFNRRRELMAEWAAYINR